MYKKNSNDNRNMNRKIDQISAMSFKIFFNF